MLVPVIYKKIFDKIIEDRSIVIYILSLCLKVDYKIIEENIKFNNNIVLFDKVIKIDVTDYINLKRINSTNFKYLEINFVKNYSSFYEEMISVKCFDNVEIYYINLEIILNNIHNKSRLELNKFERFIVLITSTSRDEIKSVITDKYLYLIYKKLLLLNTNSVKIDYENDMKELIDFSYYKKEIINEIRSRLIKYLDVSKVEEVLDL